MIFTEKLDNPRTIKLGDSHIAALSEIESNGKINGAEVIRQCIIAARDTLRRDGVLRPPFVISGQRFLSDISEDDIRSYLGNLMNPAASVSETDGGAA
jgi:hypothetical protein